MSIVTGFQNEIRNKIIGFNAPLFISKMGTIGFYECEPIHKNQTEIVSWNNTKGVKTINPVCYKPALLQSVRFWDTIKLISGKDSIVNKQEIAGVVLKGVDDNYDWSFLKKHLKFGRLPRFQRNVAHQEILISSKIASSLNYKINDQATAFYVKDQPVTKKYKVVGIFNTGLEEFDKRVVFCNIREVQRMSDFGISSQIIIDDTISKSGSILLKASISGNLNDLLFDWGKGPEIYGGIYLNKITDTTIRLIVHQMDYARNQSTPIDTANIRFYCGKKRVNSKDLTHDAHFNLTRHVLSDNSFFLFDDNQKIRVVSVPSKGTSSDYVSGFEVQINNWNELKSVEDGLKSIIEMKPTKYNELLHVQNILNTESDLFAWLAFLDYNVLIIIFLMLIIGIVNVGSAMLVLIIVRTNFIGILKAIGATNWSIRKIFLIQAANLIFRGILIGNAIGLTICFIQYKFGLFKLDPSIYYLDKVPIKLTLLKWLIINLITFFVCLMSLVIPSYVVTRISPTKSIRFN